MNIKRTAEKLVGKLRGAPTRFVVITSGRSGSNFLVSMLTGHPDIRMKNEMLGEHVLEQAEKRDAINALGPVEFVKDYFTRRRDETAVGFKFIYFHWYDSYAKQYGVPRLPEVFPYLKGDKDIRIIHLVRRNRLRRLVSQEVARITRQHMAWEASQRVESPTIRLDVAFCEEDFKEKDDQEAWCVREFSDHPFMELEYERLSDEPAPCYKEVLKFLDVKDAPLTDRLTVRQGVKPIRQVVENYDELKAHFAGTRWSGCFDE